MTFILPVVPEGRTLTQLPSSNRNSLHNFISLSFSSMSCDNLQLVRSRIWNFEFKEKLPKLRFSVGNGKIENWNDSKILIINTLSK